ncbi:MAG TPA: CHRD domain-containing protein [Candidatus Dormibacteraeota bacterium]|nr:CHRD domain-containing protein [Candidatus Dormibacteraeota bacterium]
MTKLHRCASAIGAGLLWLCAASADAALIQFTAAPIIGANETPPNGSPALATGTFTMDTVADTLSVNVVINVPPPSGENGAHIHGFAPPGTPAAILFPLPLGSPKIAVWNFSEPQEANIIAGLTYVNIHSTAFPLGEIRGQIVRVPTCGDGIVDAGETCDDGNLVSGDCCSSSCQLGASGSPCPADGDPCTLDECDGAGNCGVGAPRTGCRTAQKSLLAIKNDSTDAKDKLLWKAAARDQR